MPTAWTNICRSRLSERISRKDGRSRISQIALAVGRDMSAHRRDRGRLRFITPLAHNFCESCNRVRLTCSGTLYICLGQDAAVDLRAPLRKADDVGRRSKRQLT